MRPKGPPLQFDEKSLSKLLSQARSKAIEFFRMSKCHGMKSRLDRKSGGIGQKRKALHRTFPSSPLIERKGRTMKNIKQCPKQIEKLRTSRRGIQNYH
jgi:hypothetical protein